ncbi:YggS family pyridoxal phosphate-dependent enzyme [Aerococcaceae bacterium DSM 111176]|nr:YggS family pyridoxal phosphate-dependent enzyme [Aerococcaceae bacterium DSM 111176]
MTIKENIQHIEQTIKSKQPNAKLVAVTKSVGEEEMREVFASGIKVIGENRVPSLLEKQKALADIREEIEWHFIGNLQTRPVKDMINQIDYLHSLDRIKLAKEIQKRAEKQVKCFLQVNVSGEDSKSGFSPDEVIDAVSELAAYDKIKIVGLMTMAPIDATEDELHNYFKLLKETQVSVANKNFSHAPCTELSMGMSQDYEIALEEGATHIRVGTALYE